MILPNCRWYLPWGYRLLHRDLSWPFGRLQKIADKNGNWILALLVAVSVIAILMLFLLIMVMPKQRLIQTLTDKLNSVTRESLTGIRVVRAYNAESYQEDKFEKANTDLTQNNLFIGRSLPY